MSSPLSALPSRIQDDCFEILKYLSDKSVVSVRDVRKSVPPTDGQTASKAWVTSRIHLLEGAGFVVRDAKTVRATDEGIAFVSK